MRLRRIHLPHDDRDVRFVIKVVIVVVAVLVLIGLTLP